MKSVGNLVSKSLPTSSVTHMITVRVMMFSATQQYFSYIVVVSFIGGGNRSTLRKPLTCCMSLTNVIT